ncbi:MAG: hypothetical protein ABI346_00060 [Candidatus Baltobacteraceae bacterium]
MKLSVRVLAASVLALSAVFGFQLTRSGAARSADAVVPSITFGPEIAVPIDGVRFAPDGETSFLRQADGTYRGWIAGALKGRHGGAIEFHANALPAPLNLERDSPVLGPRADDTSSFDASYAAPGSVLADPTIAGTLYMLYEGESSFFDGRRQPGTWATIGLATSTDDGRSWSRVNPATGILSSHDPKPATSTGRGLRGNAVPSGIIADGYMYAFFAYYGDGPGGGQIQEARASLRDLGHWQKLAANTFSAAGLGGNGDPILPRATGAGAHCLAGNRQPGVSYNSYLHAYLLSMICQYGGGGEPPGPRWAFATSSDLLHWAAPTAAAEPVPEMGDGERIRFGWHPTLMSPGETSQQTTGRTGYVYYAKGVVTAPKTSYYRAFTIATP